ncbi:hypothetical protein SAMN06265361_101723 [Laceyella tengchongensis]|uniref:Uncharacterized protein n=1 Tax=Laceyella tengchongensis TaxID=574699 RepID=A0AA45WKL3_9BACL|nr:hypothetical protein SAMN06265361_101723 [Laceyella tengchongensis]
MKNGVALVSDVPPFYPMVSLSATTASTALTVAQ